MTPTTTSHDSGDRRLALDTLIRRELKVGDPSDPTSVARALMDRYQGHARAQAIEGEARGLPFLHAPLARSPGMAAPAAIDVDLEDARARVRGDLENLMTDSLAQTLRPELEGWRSAITQAVEQGVASARLAIDPGQRDVVFAMRRQLGEYARLARLVGLFSPSLRDTYRGLATNLDDVGSVLLVLAGDALANVGFSGGRFLLQTPYSDLQARRDAVLHALRRIDGVSATAGQDGGVWPRGLRAHRQINLIFEARGQGELRSLLSETELARTLDELMALAGGSTPYGLRSLGSTAWSPLNRLRRFVRAVGSLVEPSSHELAGLVEAMQLFIHGFEPAGGARLRRIARPALLGQTGGGLTDMRPADQRLLGLVTVRRGLADVVEAWLACSCATERLQAQAALDRVLFELDRAIDAYANGSVEIGLCELRASALHTLLLPLTEAQSAVKGKVFDFWSPPPAGAVTPDWVAAIRADAGLREGLRQLTHLLRPTAGNGLWEAGDADRYDDLFVNNKPVQDDGGPEIRVAQVLHDEVANAIDLDRQSEPVLRQLALRGGQLGAVLNQTLMPWQQEALDFIEAISGVKASTPQQLVEVPPHFEVSLHKLVQK